MLFFAGILAIATMASAAFLEDEGLVRRYEVSGLAGRSVHLPCEVDKASCGEFHSIKWYKNNQRVFIFSEIGTVRRAEGSLLDRTKFHYMRNGTESTLEISPLRIEDEGIYKCEITYLAVQEACSVVQFVNLTSFAEPTYQRITFEDGSPATNGSVIGPFEEGTLVTLVCESGDGKPVANVKWYNASQQLQGDYRAILDRDGTGVGINTLRVMLSRADLGSAFTCEAINVAMEVPYSSAVRIDVTVGPLNVTVSGIDSSISSGSAVALTCVATGARPPARITWYNGTTPVEQAVTDANLQEETSEVANADETYETHSRLRFVATNYENAAQFTCEASNDIKDPLQDSQILDILYAPIVRVRPENITVNETMDILIFCQYDSNPKQLTYVYWYLDNNQVDIGGRPEKYGNGNVDHPTLLIKNSTAKDMGEYTCRVANDVGASEVTNIAFVSVQYRPQVQVILDPVEPVSEDDRVNVTLICDVQRANPELLQRVRWYLDGVLLKELPECDGNETMYGSDSSLCDIDPSRLLLENVFRDFHGNYTCEGMNDAGWGPRSNDGELIVYYSPGESFISYQPPMVVKSRAVELSCNVDDPGRPVATSFRWYRGTHLVQDQTTSTWLINAASLETQDNFTCLPVNSEGEGIKNTVEIDVLAAPAFIDRLPTYTGALLTSNHVSLTCRVECSPLCEISWYKDDYPFFNDTHYKIEEKVSPPDPASGDLESIVSTLSWKMDHWPEVGLDRDRDNANFTCTSSSNVAGPGVTSNTYFRVEYPPEKVFISQESVSIVEGEMLPKIECHVSSYPESTYTWYHGKEIISTGSTLTLDNGINRKQAGEYTCMAQNKHGSVSALTNCDVQYKPECSIRRMNINGEDAHIQLICRADANPSQVHFRWRVGNETITEDVSSDGLESILRLPVTAESRGTYYCYVNNTIGRSIPCEIDITGVAEIIMMGENNIIIIIAIIAAVVIIVLFICIIIYLICRRKRQAGKYPEVSKPPITDPNNSSQDPKDNGIPNDDEEPKQFYENLPFHGMQEPPNKVECPSSSRPPSQLSHQASSGYGSTRSKKDLIQVSGVVEEIKQLQRAGRKDVSFRQDVEDNTSSPTFGFDRLKKDSESYSSMRAGSTKVGKNALARTADYFSMRLPGCVKFGGKKERQRCKGEDKHQMINQESFPNEGSEKSSSLREEETLPTTITSETKHTITSQQSTNSLVVETSQTSLLRVCTRPLSVSETNNGTIYMEKNVKVPNFTMHESGLKQKQPASNSSDLPTEEVFAARGADESFPTSTAASVPTPAPRNNANQRPQYHNLPFPSKDKAQAHPPYVVSEVCFILFIYVLLS